MKNKKIFLSPPDMSGQELGYIHDVFDSNYIAPLGAFVDRFERAIADYTKAPNVLCVNSGTAALHLALRIAGVGKGDEVFCSTFTFIGSVSPILYQHATPVFIDSDGYWNLSAALLQETIEAYLKANRPLPKALVVTHLYGQMADIKAIAAICQAHNIILIEDAAEAMGSFFEGTHAGLFGDFGIFSFNGNKIITTSGGGALVCKNAENLQKAKFLATAAKDDALHYQHTDYGYNYRLSNVLAAIGVGQMEVLEKRVEQRRAIFDDYQEHLQKRTIGFDIDFMPEIKGARGNRWLTTVILPFAYEGLLERLHQHHIEARPLWKPMHLQPLFQDTHLAIPKAINQKAIDGTSERLFTHGLCLPSGSALTAQDVVYICQTLQALLEEGIA